MDSQGFCILALLVLLVRAKAECIAFCQGEKFEGSLTLSKFGEKQYVSSPNSADYVTDNNCYISVQVTLNAPHVVHVEQQVATCYVPYKIRSRSNEQIAHRYVHCNSKDEVMTHFTDVPYNRNTTNGFRILLSSGFFDVFNFSITAYPLLSMEPTNSTVNLTTAPTAYITSHQGFPESTYSNDLHNILTLTDIPSGYDVVIEFVYIQLGHNHTCHKGMSANDILKVYKSPNSVLYECGDITDPTSPPLPPLIANASDPMNPIVLEFTTNEEGQFPGFLLKLTVIGYKPSESAPEATAMTQRTTMQAEKPNSSQRATTGEPETEQTRTTQTKATTSPITESTKESQTDTISKANDSASESTANTPSSITTNRSQLYTIAGGAGGGLFILLIVIAVLACVLYRRSENRKESSLRCTPHCVNSADAVDNSEFEWRAEGGTNMHLENPYFGLEPPEHVEMQPQTDQNTSHAPPGGASSRTRSEPAGMDINALYTPVVKKDKLEMLENSLYGSA